MTKKKMNILHMLAKLCAGAFLLSLALLCSEDSLAQQTTISVSEADEFDDFIFLPSCAQRSSMAEGCVVAVLRLPESMVANYTEATQSLRERTENYGQYSRTRSGKLYLLSFPPGGGIVSVEKPGASLQDNEFEVPSGDPGTVQYYEIEEVPYRSSMARNRAERQREPDSVFPPSRLGSGGNSEERQERTPPESDTATETSSTQYTSRVRPRKDYRTGFLYSVDYLSTVRINSSLFRSNDNMTDFVTGSGFAFTAYYLDGFSSGRAGIAYIDSEGGYIQENFSSDISEFLDYSYISAFVSYSPTFQIFESRTTYALLYTDIGASAALVNLRYDDVQIDYYNTFQEETTFAVEMIEQWLPGIHFGFGFLFNYKYVGFHAGIQYEAHYLYDDSFIIGTAYPMLGITIRGNQN